MTPLGTLSESMFGTTDIDGAVTHWTTQLGFELTFDNRPGWVMLTDPRSSQRFVLMGESEGFEPCLGMDTPDFEGSLAHITANGGSVSKRSPEGETGFQWACCTDAYGIQLMMWHTPEEA